ncbi:hypothetical protein EAH75_04380 [Rhodanobacter glycinis]|uniref:hypothetical protein n=1 Tax=Rhodanobacter glycinis TaxID=582702 RepID=UPI001169E2CD|nr:hypothetical protein [Rhodanobacter glycinis]TPG50682.1 hypothetical protein EAH75_04380 [Rhodanobacter glycinis]
MLATLESKLIALGAVVLLLLGAYAWAHHRGAVSQQAVDATVITQKTLALSAAGESLANAAAALRAASAATIANRDAAAAARAIAATAAKHADEAKQALANANAAWQAKFKAAQGAKGCETLQEQICESAMGY